MKALLRLHVIVYVSKFSDAGKAAISAPEGLKGHNYDPNRSALFRENYKRYSLS